MNVLKIIEMCFHLNDAIKSQSQNHWKQLTKRTAMVASRRFKACSLRRRTRTPARRRGLVRVDPAEMLKPLHNLYSYSIYSYDIYIYTSSVHSMSILCLSHDPTPTSKSLIFGMFFWEHKLGESFWVSPRK